ncbi:FAD-dependent oxidoreductase [Virgibacillus profundi]|uniref:FAD-dependent oxidoreductase n=1 Tax=Virgibacillus profundi TaxID=2024555 RepID=A0A2A2IDK1_9BACI|nr:FAD-binding oxidoreductase [Virgibacillus profundi]PAV29652.1 FAD-dependent oxidoreductase [Virgibacillus profundi]PXY53824.1 FAD-binding oxidoreductase [Virgibacillus profundi]
MAGKFIIIGSGIVGATTAYQLTKSGAEVIVADRRDDGQATDAAAGIVCPWLSQRRNKAWYHLAKNGARVYPQLIQELQADGEEDTGYARVGAISLHTDEVKLTAMRDRALKRREDAPEIGEVTLLDPEQTKAMFPLLKDGYGAVHVSGAARVDGRKLRDALLRGAQKHGASVIHGDASIVHKGTQVTGVKINDEIFEADKVIAATGAWMGELFKPLDVEFNIVPQRAQIMHVHVPDMDNSLLPVVMPPGNQYLLAFDDRIVLGSTHEDDSGFDYRVTAGGQHEILTKALDVAPGLTSSTVLETRVGFRPVAPGFLPVIGPLPGFDGLLLANGLGASGLTMGPYIGMQLAQLALGEELEFDLADYSVAGAIQ